MELQSLNNCRRHETLSWLSLYSKTVRPHRDISNLCSRAGPVSLLLCVLLLAFSLCTAQDGRVSSSSSRARPVPAAAEQVSLQCHPAGKACSDAASVDLSLITFPLQERVSTTSGTQHPNEPQYQASEAISVCPKCQGSRVEVELYEYRQLEVQTRGAPAK